MPLHTMIAKLREKWSNRRAARRVPKLKSRQRLELELLETRDLFSVSPVIVSVTPPNGGTLVEPLTANQNVIKVTYSEAMNANAATPTNYLLFGPTGNTIAITSVAEEGATNTYDVTFAGGQPAGAYSLFVKGDQVNASAANGGLPLANPGQLVVANSTGSVSTITAPDGFGSSITTLGATQTYALGPNAGGFGGFSSVVPEHAVIADFNGDGFLDLAIAVESGGASEVDIYTGKASGGFDATPAVRLPAVAGNDFPGAMAAFYPTTGAATGFADIAVLDSNTNEVNIFTNTGTAGAAPIFNPAVEVASGATRGVALATGDFNNDGRTDLAVLDNAADANGNFNIDFLQGLGGGNFAGPVAFAVGNTATNTTTLQNPTSFAVGSLRTANSTDLVVGGSNGIETIIGNNTFAPTVGQLINSSTNGSLFNNITSVRIGNLDGDATPGDAQDVAAMSGASVEVLTNLDLGTGTLNTATPTILSLGAVGHSMGLSPQTPGGKADIVVVSSVANEVIVLHNTSTAATTSFAAPADYAVDTDPVGLAIGDLNGDTSPDIVTVNDASFFQGGTFSVLRNNGDGTYGTPAVLTAAASQPDAIAVGDVNADNVPDLVVANKAANTVTVYLGGNTTATLGTYPTVASYSIKNGAAGASPVSVTLADVNGDGFLDIITANAGDSTISVLLNNGNGTFGPATTYAVGETPTQVVAGLFNSSGKISLAVAHNGNGSDILSRGVTLLLGNGDGTFQAGQEILPNVAATAIVAGNFTEAAGQPLDLAVADGDNGQVDLLRNNGMGIFTNAASDVYAVGAHPSALAVGDFNRDGFQDVVAVSSDATGAAQQIAVLLNSAGGGFAAAVYSALPFNFPVHSVAVANLNGYDYPDLVVGLTGASAFSFSGNSAPADADLYTLIGNGDGSFSLPVPYMTGPKATNTIVAVSSNPLVLATTFNLQSQIVNVDVIKNGNFEARDLDGTAGTFAGWNTAQVNNSRGGWYLQSGTLSPLSQTTVPPPVATGTVANNYQAMADESNLQPLTPTGGTPFADTPATYAGSNFLYQDITLPPTTSPASLSFNLNLYINSAYNNGTNLGGGQFGGYTGNETSLDFNNPGNNADQQVRIDFMDPTQPIDSTSVYLNLFQTNAQTPQTGSYVLTTTGNSAAAAQLRSELAALLSTYAGKTVRLRISVVNNQGKLIVGVDNVSFKIQYTDTTPPVLAGPQLRNPGYLIANPASPTTTIPSTTDPTLIGTVSDDGGVRNIKEVELSTDPNFLIDVAIVGPAGLDANGHFVADLPSLAPSLNPITIYSRVIDDAGNVSAGTPFTFQYQGPSNTNWQEVGPGPISVKGISNQEYSTVVGRINAIIVDPTDTSGNTYITAGDNGGIWRTTDGGVDWTPTTDFLVDANGNPINAPIGAMGGSINHANNTFVIYAGMGDSDVEPSSRSGNGILISTDGGIHWSVAGNSETVLANSRISAIVVDPTNYLIAYAAVESGGIDGPGVYKTTDGGLHWTDVFSTTVSATTANNIFGPSTSTSNAPIFANGTALASVTSMAIDPFNSLELTIGVGNVGLVPLGNGTAGVYRTEDGGGSWRAVVGGVTTTLNDKLPGPVDVNGNPTSGISPTIGRVTVAYATGIDVDTSTLYVLVSSPPAANPTPGGSIAYGNTQAVTLDDPKHGPATYLNGTPNIYGLFKSGNQVQDVTAFTHVMVREVNSFVDNPNDVIPSYHDINFSGVDASNTGTLIVDPTDPNVVYVGGSEEYPGNVASDGLLRIDTGNMVDTTFNTGDEGVLNNGDDRTKRAAARDSDGDGDDIYEYPVSNDQGYLGEGVSWLNLTINAFEDIGFPSGGNFSNGESLPPNITSVAIDAQGRIVFGTEQGLYRLVYQGAGYDYTSGGDNNGIIQRTEGLATAPPGQTLAKVPNSLVTLTEINGNLQISDLTSATLDPSFTGRLYTTQYNTGAAVTSGALTYDSSGLYGGGATGGTFLGGGIDEIPDGDAVVVAPPDPSAPSGTLNTIYEVYAYGTRGEFESFQLVTSTQGGTADSITNLPTTNFGVNDNAGYLPVLSIDPNKIYAFVPTAGKFEYLDGLLFATDRVYVSRDSGAQFAPYGSSGPLQSGAYITAAEFAPTNDSVVWAGTNKGEVFVTVLNPNTGTYSFKEMDTGLPTGLRVDSITVSPVNSNIAFVTETSATGAGEIFVTVNGGASWSNITGNLSAGRVYALVDDPRSQPGSSAPNGRLYVGTDTGVYYTVNGGANWFRLGQGLAHVPVIGLQLSTGLETLLAATDGRGAFEISTDYVGAYVVSVTPATPVNGYATPLTTVTVTFNKSISSFPASAVTIMGPYGTPIAEIGTPTNVSTPAPGYPNPDNVWQITFAPQTADGDYTFTIGPNVIDQLGHTMDQNHNGVNGQATDAYTFQVALNSTDDGQFVTGQFNDELGRSADTTGFINFLAPIDAARASVLSTVATEYVTQNARPQIVQDLYGGYNGGPSILGVANNTTTGLIGRAATTSEENFWLSLLQGGLSYEQMIVQLTASTTYFAESRVNGNDSNFVTAIYSDLLGRGAGAQGPAYVTQLSNAEIISRIQDARALLGGQPYESLFIQNTFQAFLGRQPSASELSGQLSLFNQGYTQEQIIAEIMGGPEFYADAPGIAGDGSTGNTALVEAVYKKLLTGYTPGPGEIQGWVNALNAGTLTANQFVSMLDTGTVYRFGTPTTTGNSGLVYTAYENYLGRPAYASDEAAWQSAYANPGFRTEDFYADVLGGPEYFGNNTTAGTPLPSQDQQWADALYSNPAVLGATNETAESTRDLPFLTNAEVNARAAIAQGLVGSLEYKYDVVSYVYHSDLGRAPGAAELAYYAPLVGQNGAPGGPNGDEQLIADVLSSNEFFLDAPVDANHLHTNATWALQLYPKLHLAANTTSLNAAQQAQLTGAVGAIDAAYAPTRLTIIQDFQTSPEHYAYLTQQAYQLYLGRAANAGEVAQWILAYQGGETQEQQIASILSSQEYYLRAPLIVGGGALVSPKTFIDAAYLQLFPGYTITPQAEQAYENFLGPNPSAAVRLQVTQGLVASALYRFGAPSGAVSPTDPTIPNNGFVERAYQQYLGRPMSAAELSVWESVYANDPAFLTTTFLADVFDSTEYFAKTHQFP